MIFTTESRVKCSICCPSQINFNSSSESPLNRNSISTSEGNTNGLDVKECGEIGVIKMENTSGCTIGPPEDREYAVEPVGVLIMIPSDL